MQAVGSFVLPKNGVYTTNFCSSESFPAAIDPFINLLAARGDLDRAAATHRDRIETSARGFLESDATSCMDSVVSTTNGSITIEIEVEVRFKGSSSTRIGIDPAGSIPILVLLLPLKRTSTSISMVMEPLVVLTTLSIQLVASLSKKPLALVSMRSL